ncbi:MAG: pantoate--beta-alanine ligase [Pseudomonadales bacterium]
MNVFDDLTVWRAARRNLAGSVGLVATMGALHRGHGALLERSLRECDHTVLSVYLNPTQFNDPRDLENYPRTLDADLAMARQLGVGSVILPTYAQLYPDGFRYRVDETSFSRELCGTHRPGHFTGVLTVVLKLLNLVRPDRAYFGEKDYQQYRLIRGMTDALFLDTEIVPCATVREDDGLALSSRNALLEPQGRRLAPRFHCLLGAELPDLEVARLLDRAGFEVDYVETRDHRRYGAVTLRGRERKVRLIDNVAVGEAAADGRSGP